MDSVGITVLSVTVRLDVLVSDKDLPSWRQCAEQDKPQLARLAMQSGLATDARLDREIAVLQHPIAASAPTAA